MKKLSRRDFFRKSASKMLPVMAIAAFSTMGIERLQAKVISDCRGCSGNCSGDCSGYCTGSCYGGCDGGCRAGCSSCKGYCTGSNAQCN